MGNDSRNCRSSRRESPNHSFQEGCENRSVSNVLEIASEVTEVNTHTLNNEFHGPTSSLAFLAAIQKQNKHQPHSARDYIPVSEDSSSSLVSTFHNETFSPTSATYTNSDWQLLSANTFYFRQSQQFLYGYFQNLHYIHPFVERENFLLKCEDIWFGRSSKQSRSFIALYYAIMSLGALTREWDEDSLYAMNRFDWSRKMFRLATIALGDFPGSNDLESVQAYIIMAKVCQNELNPNLAYMYLGHAIRTSLSAGYNRRSPTPGLRDQEMSRTWWGLFSLEMETSFALGRPDSLGHEIYHSRSLPAVEESPTAIITCMVDLAKLVRKVSISVYLSGDNIEGKLRTAEKIDSELEQWIGRLPQIIRPSFPETTGDDTGLRSAIPMWANRQSHTLLFRYYNIKMVLYRPFLLYAVHRGRGSGEAFDEAVAKCVSAASKTIEFMNYMFCNFSYFRTWWYNTTYTLYAASIIVFYAQKTATLPELQGLLRLIHMGIDILKIMDENVVAKKAADLMQKASLRIRERELRSDHQDPMQRSHSITQSSTAENTDRVSGPLFEQPAYDPFDEDQLDFMTQLFPLSTADGFMWGETDNPV